MNTTSHRTAKSIKKAISLFRSPSIGCRKTSFLIRRIACAAYCQSLFGVTSTTNTSIFGNTSPIRNRVSLTTISMPFPITSAASLRNLSCSLGISLIEFLCVSSPLSPFRNDKFRSRPNLPQLITNTLITIKHLPIFANVATLIISHGENYHPWLRLASKKNEKTESE